MEAIKSDFFFSARRACDQSSVLIRNGLNSAGEHRHLLEKLCDVLAAALGPGPGIGVIVEGRSHDVILLLHACLPALWVVIVRHVEPGAGREKGHTQSDYQPLNGSVVARRINVIRFTFKH